MTPLEKFKIRLRISLSNTSEDDLLNLILEDAQNAILDFCNRSSLLPIMESLQRELAVEFYNRQGAEGESSRSEGGISVSYSTEIPESIKTRLVSYRLLKGAKIANASMQ